MPKISVIIPVYNSEKFLSRALNSVLMQTYENLEIICINDGSTDNSLKILEEYQSKDSRIIVKTIENSGAAGARNCGLNIASGDYVSFLDSDDWLNLTMYETFVKSISKAPVDICFFNLGLFAKQEKDALLTLSTQIEDWTDWESEESILTFDNCCNPFGSGMHVANKIYSREFLETNKFRFLDGIIMEDFLFNIQTLLAAKSLKVNFEIFYWYNKANEGSVTRNYGKKVFDFFVIVDEINKSVISKNLYEDYKYALFQFNYNTLFSIFKVTEEPFREEYYNKMTEFLSVFDLNDFDSNICEQLEGYKEFETFRRLNNSDAFYKYLNEKSFV